MAYRVHKVSDLRRIIKESSEVFKPVMGKNVESDNKKINDEAYKEMAKATSKYDGGARVEKKMTASEDDNKGMESLQYENMSSGFSNNVKSQMKGYFNDQNEKLHKNEPYGNAEFKEIKGIGEKAKNFKKSKDTAKEIGLTSKEIDKKEFEKQKKTVFDESKIVKLNFKNTVFMTEQHMLSRVPDIYKTEGRKFVMKDKNNTEYLVEWHTEEDPKILNKKKLNEDLNKIKHLFNYKSGDNNPKYNNNRVIEEGRFNNMLDRARKLMS